MLRKIQVLFSAAGLAMFFVIIATISAGAQTTGARQSGSEGGDGRVSQGTVTGLSPSELNAVQRTLTEEEQLPDYSQVVDDTTDGRFEAPGWNRGVTDGLAHGGSYTAAAAGAGDARFKLKVPTSNDYSLYAWWPSQKGSSTAARFGVRTSSGTKWTTVDQSKDGGYWVEIGTYHMEAGDYYAVSVPADGGSGVTVADAVALVRGVTAPPPDALAPADRGQVSAGATLRTGDATFRASTSGRVTGRQLIRQGRKHMGTRYRLSPPAPCRAFEVEDCSCFTHFVFGHFSKKLPDSPIRQWRYGHRISAKSNLRRGDLVFFKENGYSNPITHVGMYSGNGYILHASSYYGKVVNSQMRYLNGYYGAKRIRPRQ